MMTYEERTLLLELKDTAQELAKALEDVDSLCKKIKSLTEVKADKYVIPNPMKFEIFPTNEIERRLDENYKKQEKERVNYFKANEVAEGEIGKLFEKARQREWDKTCEKVEENKKAFDWSDVEPPMNPEADEIVPTVEDILSKQYPKKKGKKNGR